MTLLTTRRRGLSLLEMAVATIVIAIIGAATLPMVAGATDMLVSSARVRRVTDDASLALERVSRMLREAPARESDDGVAIASIESDGFTLEDGSGVRLDGDTLVIRDASAHESILMRDVDVFTLTPLLQDGVTGSSASPSQTQRVLVRVESRGLVMTGLVFVRVWTVPA